VAADPQLLLVPERIRAHPGQANQRLVLARVEPAVLHLDIVSPLVSFRFAVCSDVESRMESQFCEKARNGVAGASSSLTIWEQQV